MSGVLRSVKNVTKGYSTVQVKVRKATSNDPWGPTGADMADIAKITYNSSTDFYEVVDMLDKRLNDKGKNWRHVLKSLKVLDYCLHEGSELVVTWARKNIYIIKTLREFIYVDDSGRDVGASIRLSAKELTSLIMDEERLRSERANRGSWKSRVSGLEEVGVDPEFNQGRQTKNERPQRGNDDDDDLEMRLALEASKNEAEQENLRRSTVRVNDDDDDLQKALRLSKEEDDARKREHEDQQQASLLFDDPNDSFNAQPTGFNQGYQQQTAVDWFGNPMQQQQPQQTGYLNNAYNQPTGFQNGYGNYTQPQQTGWDQMQQPQQQQLQPQNTYNPWAQQMPQNGFAQQQPIQEQPTATPGSNNPWASSGSSMSAMQPQQTGSNNPFASSTPNTQSPFGKKAPTLNTLQENMTAQQFNNRNTSSPFATQQQQQAPPPQAQPPPQQQQPQDPYQARLNALLASGDGMDTFGNTGEMRIPAQHTAPGTFVNSAGQGGMGRLESTKTGNPFFAQQFTGAPRLQGQFTGAPQQQQQQQGQSPFVSSAQTGPAPFAGGSNPFGPRPGQQQQGGPGGSLIDL